MKSRAEIRAALTGPGATLRTPFNQDGGIDYASLRNMIDFDISAGSKVIVLTIGDSLFTILTDQEIADLTRVVVEHTAGRAMVVAADKYWWTGKAVEFARYARDVGADVVMVSPPDWGNSCTPRTYLEHYAAVAEHIPVMVVTAVFIPRGMNFALETLKILVNEAENIVAIKDDFCGEFARRMSLLVYDRWAVWSGGLKQNHLNNFPYGCDGYLSTFITFKPEVAHHYWAAIKAQDLGKARAVIQKYEMALFDFLNSANDGKDGRLHLRAGLHGVMELFGLCKRWRRKPYYSLNDEEMERLEDFLKRLALL